MCRNRYESVDTPAVSRAELVSYLVRRFSSSTHHVLDRLDKCRYGQGKKKPSLRGEGQLKVVVQSGGHMLVPASLATNGVQVLHFKDVRLDYFYRELLGLMAGDLCKDRRNGRQRMRSMCCKKRLARPVRAH